MATRKTSPRPKPAPASPSQTSIQFLGHATFKVTTPEGKVVLVDPWLTDNPAVPEELRAQDKADLILITHGHSDHFDRDIVGLITRTGAKVAANNVCRWFLLEQGVAPEAFEALNEGGTAALPGLSVTMVPARHAGHISLGEGRIGYTHTAVGFMLRLADGLTIYFAGDTALFGDMALLGELYRPDVAVLPIGGRFTMGPREAARAAELLGVKHVVPCHYATFEELAGTPAELRALTRPRRGLHIHELAPGESLALTKTKAA